MKLTTKPSLLAATCRQGIVAGKNDMGTTGDYITDRIALASAVGFGNGVRAMILKPSREESKKMLADLRDLLGDGNVAELLVLTPQTLRRGRPAVLSGERVLRLLQVIHGLFVDNSSLFELLTVTTQENAEKLSQVQWEWEGQHGFCDGSGI